MISVDVIGSTDLQWQPHIRSTRMRSLEAMKEGEINDDAPVVRPQSDAG